MNPKLLAPEERNVDHLAIFIAANIAGAPLERWSWGIKAWSINIRLLRSQRAIRAIVTRQHGTRSEPGRLDSLESLCDEAECRAARRRREELRLQSGQARE